MNLQKRAGSAEEPALWCYNESVNIQNNTADYGGCSQIGLGRGEPDFNAALLVHTRFPLNCPGRTIVLRVAESVSGQHISQIQVAVDRVSSGRRDAAGAARSGRCTVPIDRAYRHRRAGGEQYERQKDQHQFHHCSFAKLILVNQLHSIGRLHQRIPLGVSNQNSFQFFHYRLLS